MTSLCDLPHTPPDSALPPGKKVKLEAEIISTAEEAVTVETNIEGSKSELNRPSLLPPQPSRPWTPWPGLVPYDKRLDPFAQAGVIEDTRPIPQSPLECLFLHTSPEGIVSRGESKTITSSTEEVPEQGTDREDTGRRWASVRRWCRQTGITRLIVRSDPDIIDKLNQRLIDVVLHHGDHDDDDDDGSSYLQPITPGFGTGKLSNAATASHVRDENALTTSSIANTRAVNPSKSATTINDDNDDARTTTSIAGTRESSLSSVSMTAIFNAPPAVPIDATTDNSACSIDTATATMRFFTDWNDFLRAEHIRSFMGTFSDYTNPLNKHGFEVRSLSLPYARLTHGVRLFLDHHRNITLKPSGRTLVSKLNPHITDYPTVSPTVPGSVNRPGSPVSCLHIEREEHRPGGGTGDVSSVVRTAFMLLDDVDADTGMQELEAWLLRGEDECERGEGSSKGQRTLFVADNDGPNEIPPHAQQFLLQSVSINGS